MTKKPRQVSDAAWAWPEATPAMIQRRMRRSFHLTGVARGEVAATTLAPVTGEAIEG